MHLLRYQQAKLWYVQICDGVEVFVFTNILQITVPKTYVHTSHDESKSFQGDMFSRQLFTMTFYEIFFLPVLNNSDDVTLRHFLKKSDTTNNPNVKNKKRKTAIDENNAR